MLVLLMASALRYQLPSVVFEQPNELAELHSPIVPRLSAGPCPERLDQRELRSGDEDLAVRERLGSAHHCSVPAILFATRPWICFVKSASCSVRSFTCCVSWVFDCSMSTSLSVSCFAA